MPPACYAKLNQSPFVASGGVTKNTTKVTSLGSFVFEFFASATALMQILIQCVSETDWYEFYVILFQGASLYCSPYLNEPLDSSYRPRKYNRDEE